MAKPQFPIKRIAPKEMRDRFNGIDYAAKLAAGELVEHVLENRHPSLTAANEPYCTRSQMVSYRDQVSNDEVARVHQYLRPDGTIGASGLPDPKRVLDNGTLYRLRKGTPEPPPEEPSKIVAVEDGHAAAEQPVQAPQKSDDGPT